MKILLAKDAGYCFGVRDAVNLAYDTAKDHGEVYMLGTIVHNEKVVEDLSKSGTKVVDKLVEVPSDRPILFRAHGTAPSVWDKAKNKSLNIIDATCPLVTEIHDEIKKLEAEGRRTIIIGDHGHDEVVGIAAQVKDPIILANVKEAKALRKMKKVGVVSQSTQMIENVQEIINVLMQKVFDLRFVNTICFPTRRNHEQIKELATQCEVMIIIGSFTSANSKRLTQLALERNKRSYQVTCADDMEAFWFENCETVGISAGASTPDDIIRNVVEKIKGIGHVTKEEIVYE
ncbi:MAG: 4-hydroxy-3-methylbut-2-enyl diphosphate reductase [Candidatus Marinimicrobia bacterium]|jgi:4-hydroxy-3-methylbut-2-en-1-yl diphosphate reductase|nr:4-hydroxy-3-methylbut-2-enyl diphosphate reductase [Candidatus Neomarinimicrobiota bacterium]MBT3849514.1 4-hydroxy-3-methylbut-2-enyl diphosphate reductase [Candidatus Neomarinimicrobiota bacterium]MBT4053716.1 4-hydroxy-3-methylbut-2-enyl diphosphate reductase [Candidatus Neomarinimicrobiota bacterium]MBT4662139.1 4-hydroxy-3-methylbut-2-enyl diphosphate reductase [Candidatus Neomarinimicrobiota bacterium]MBT4827451.1 4-hydroxy-3-methylbut-2-enyl diphosphate reductase [Candidatus Neomarini